MTAGHGGFELRVVDDATSLGINEKHAPGLQATLLDDLLGLDSNRAHLGSADNTVIVHDIEAARSQAVAVEICTAEPPISEREQGRPVPWLHLARGPLVESGLLGVHERISLPRLWYHQHNSFGERENTVDGEELQDVVECSRV
jgi:hypothetical protein